MYLHCVAMFSSRTNLYLIGLQALFALLLVIQSCAISFLSRTTNIPMTEKLENALRAFARVPLLNGPTTIQRLTRIEEVLGAERHGVNLFVKRDDEASLGGGGNKLRKLEFHLGAAKVAAVDTVLTVGGLQSNHARLTAAACARLGLTCELFLSRSVPRNDDNYERSGNVLLDNIFGANTHIVPSGESALEAAEKRAEQLRALGRQVLVIPTGGSTPLGCLGYASCALEISHQEAQLDKPFRQIIVSNGSSGTHAGLAAGFKMLGRGARSVRSFSVLADRDAAADTTLRLTRETLQLLGHPNLPVLDEIDVDGAYRGDGYGIPTDEMISAVRLMAAHEGLLIDPVYSGKAFAGLLADVRHGRYAPGDNLLFVMTGGTPGLYAYRDVFEQS